METSLPGVTSLESACPHGCGVGHPYPDLPQALQDFSNPSNAGVERGFHALGVGKPGWHESRVLEWRMLFLKLALIQNETASLCIAYYVVKEAVYFFEEDNLGMASWRSRVLITGSRTGVIAHL